jgi:hypothetical protein
MSAQVTPAPRPAAAVYYLTHLWSPSIAYRFDRLRRELGPAADCFVLLQEDAGSVITQWKAFLGERGASDALVPFEPATLLERLGYRWFGDSIMGSTHFPLLDLSRSRSYRHYWLVESDVEYRGNWHALLDAWRGCEADLLACHLRRHADWPGWGWWRTLRWPSSAQLGKDQLHRAFLPFFRISLTALQALDQAHRDGWKGHFEALVPTVLQRAGMTVQDLRATVPCYLGESQNPSASLTQQSTMRWRPEIRTSEFKGRGSGPLLFHPVKEDWAYDGDKVLRWAKPQAPR